MMHKTQTKRPS